MCLINCAGTTQTLRVEESPSRHGGGSRRRCTSNSMNSRTARRRAGGRRLYQAAAWQMTQTQRGIAINVTRPTCVTRSKRLPIRSAPSRRASRDDGAGLPQRQLTRPKIVFGELTRLWLPGCHRCVSLRGREPRRQASLKGRHNRRCHTAATSSYRDTLHAPYGAGHGNQPERCVGTAVQRALRRHGAPVVDGPLPQPADTGALRA